MKAKDITDALICAAVKACTKNADTAYRNALHTFLEVYPQKLVDAKLRQATLKGLLGGCSSSRCKGCAGDYHLTPKGEELLQTAMIF